MDKKELRLLHRDTLLELFMSCAKDLSKLRDTGSLFLVDAKRKESEMIDLILIERKSEFPPF